MAVDPGAAVPGNVLEDRQHAACEQPLAQRQAETRDPLRLDAIGAVADHRIGPGNRQVEHRKAIDGDAELGEIVGDQPGAEPGRLLRGWVRQRSDAGGRRIKPPFGRPQPRNPSALLVDQNRRVGTPDAAAQLSTSART